MRKALDQIPSWLVVPVAIFGAYLLFASHRVASYPTHTHEPPRKLDAAANRAATNFAHTGRAASNSHAGRVALGTPPVAGRQSVTTSGMPAPQLLPRLESDSAGLAKASNVLPMSGGTSLPQGPALSDAVSVPAPADHLGQQSDTGWQPMNSAGLSTERPVPLPPVDQVFSEARIAAPLPRYALAAPDWDEMPLIAPIEQGKVSEERRSSGLIDLMFAPPSALQPQQLAASESATTEDAAPNAPYEESPRPNPKQPEVEVTPLPPIRPSLAESIDAPVRSDEDEPLPPIPKMPEPVLMPFPPVERSMVESTVTPPLTPAEETPTCLPDTPKGAPTYPSRARLFTDQLFEPPLIASVEELPQSPDDISQSVLEPLPPVDPGVGSPSDVPATAPLVTPVAPLANGAEPDLIQLPTVAQTDPAQIDSAAVAMIDRLFSAVELEPAADSPSQPPIEEEPEISVRLAPPTDPIVKDETSQPLDSPSDEEMAEAEDAPDSMPQSLPAIERTAESENDTLEAASDEDRFDPRSYERSWELELIAREADKHSRRAFQLANKKAYYSARMEFTRALRMIAQGLDTQRGTNRHSQALAAGLRAMVEAEDFLPQEGHLEADLNLAVIAGAHRTPVLREVDSGKLTPLEAMRLYHTYTQQQLAAAVGRETAGSMALCGLGKLYIAMGDQQRGEGIAAARPKAMALLQAALIVAPANNIASNELGVLLAESGRHSEARAAFEHSVRACPTAEAWRNLALTCEQLGEMDEAYFAARQTLALRAKTNDTDRPATVSNHGTVRWVTPDALARTGGNLRTANTRAPGRVR